MTDPFDAVGVVAIKALRKIHSFEGIIDIKKEKCDKYAKILSLGTRRIRFRSTLNAESQ